METTTGEFAIWHNNKKFGIVFYRAYSKYYKDIFKNGSLVTKRSIEISKYEYLKKLESYILILKNERNEKHERKQACRNATNRNDIVGF